MLRWGLNRNSQPCYIFLKLKFYMYPHLLYCKFRKLIQKGEKTLPNQLCRFPKLLQEDLIRGCLGPRGHFLLEMLSLSLSWHQDRKKKIIINNNWHSYCTQSFKSTSTSNKKECKDKFSKTVSCPTDKHVLTWVTSGGKGDPRGTG